MQQRLNFRPLPQGQGWLRAGYPMARAIVGACGSARTARIALSAWPASDRACSRRISMRASRKAAAVTVGPADSRARTRCWAGVKWWPGAVDWGLLISRGARERAEGAGLRR